MIVFDNYTYQNNCVGVAIESLAHQGEIVRTMRATFIARSMLESMITNFVTQLGYDSVVVDIEEKQDDKCEVFIEIKTKTISNRGFKFSVVDNRLP